MQSPFQCFAQFGQDDDQSSPGMGGLGDDVGFDIVLLHGDLHAQFTQFLGVKSEIDRASFQAFVDREMGDHLIDHRSIRHCGSRGEPIQGTVGSGGGRSAGGQGGTG